MATSRHGNAIRITGVFTWWLHDMEMLSALQGCSHGDFTTWNCYPHYRSVHMVTSRHGNAIRITGVFTWWLLDMEMLSALQGCSHGDFSTWKFYPHDRSFVKGIHFQNASNEDFGGFFAASLNNYWTNSRALDELGRHGTCVTSR